MKLTKLPVFTCVFALSVFTSGMAAAGPLILRDDAFITPTVDTRFRYESGSLDTLDVSHNGSMRSRLGLMTKKVHGFQVFGEYEGTRVVDRQSYRAASVHGPATKTVIADPESNEINQLWVSYESVDKTVGIKAGRQAINIDNQRYVGGVAWRQNMQTFDAATLKWTPTSDLEVSYGYISQVNRIFGSDVFFAPHTDFEGDTHLVNVKLKSLPLGTLTGYAYSMDLTNRAGSATSNTSLGLSLAGDVFDTSASYYLEYAHQTDAHNSPRNYAANYGHGYLSYPICENLKLTGGLEYLGSDNNVGYQFPLGTNHKFNGFADVFLATPPVGLINPYVSLATTLPCDIGAALFYHHFENEDWDLEFGNEIDLVLTKKINDRISLLGKGAYYMGSVDTTPDLTRMSIELNYKY
ncbi:MAG: alginate export family protein [Verrucomicrobiales bacterium]|nr:alginate export family protein [Verrucomicrobiales bacterium]